MAVKRCRPNNAIRLILTPPGDATNDGAVQFDDFVILAEYFGTDGVDWEQGDFDGDGQVQFPDFVLLANNFGSSANIRRARAVEFVVGHRVNALSLASASMKKDVAGSRTEQLAERAAREETLFNSEDATEFLVCNHQGHRWSTLSRSAESPVPAADR